MKLPHDLLASLVAARECMGADLVECAAVTRPDPLMWPDDTTEVTIGRENIDEIGRGERGEIVVRGKYALLYIQDTGHARARLENAPETSMKYHTHHCRTLEGMLRNGRFERYVATLRDDGWFVVDAREQDRSASTLDARLAPCGNCLALIGHRGDRSMFSVKDYLARNTGLTRSGPMPATRDTDHRPSEYTSDWAHVSHRVRERAGWCCTECGVDLHEDRRLLHVHHVNGVRSDNRERNLRALCVLCHDARPNHRLNVSPADAERIRRRRREIDPAKWSAPAATAGQAG